MSTTQRHRRFAYGSDTFDECACPAVHAGYSPSGADDSLAVAEEYDAIIRTLFDPVDRHSTVGEEKAKEAWLTMIQTIEQKEWYEPRDKEVAVEIAEELNWL